MTCLLADFVAVGLRDIWQFAGFICKVLHSTMCNIGNSAIGFLIRKHRILKPKDLVANLLFHKASRISDYVTHEFVEEVMK